MWCILIEERSQCTLISFTGPTELKSSSPFISMYNLTGHNTTLLKRVIKLAPALKPVNAAGTFIKL